MEKGGNFGEGLLHLLHSFALTACQLFALDQVWCKRLVRQWTNDRQVDQQVAAYRFQIDHPQDAEEVDGYRSIGTWLTVEARAACLRVWSCVIDIRCVPKINK